MSFPPTQIETERLRLRLPRRDDAEAMFAGWSSDPEATRFVGFRRHRSVGDARLFIELSQAGWRGESPMRPYLIERRSDAEVIGSTGYVFESGVSLGYVLAPAAWGQGYASEVARTQVEVALACREIHRVWAVCDCDNAASARVLEKAGMSREGILRRWGVHPQMGSEPRDCYVYAAVRPISS